MGSKFNSLSPGTQDTNNAFAWRAGIIYREPVCLRCMCPGFFFCVSLSVVCRESRSFQTVFVCLFRVVINGCIVSGRLYLTAWKTGTLEGNGAINIILSKIRDCNLWPAASNNGRMSCLRKLLTELWFVHEGVVLVCATSGVQRGGAGKGVSPKNPLGMYMEVGSQSKNYYSKTGMLEAVKTVE